MFSEKNNILNKYRETLNQPNCVSSEKKQFGAYQININKQSFTITCFAGDILMRRNSFIQKHSDKIAMTNDIYCIVIKENIFYASNMKKDLNKNK